VVFEGHRLGGAAEYYRRDHAYARVRIDRKVRHGDIEPTLGAKVPCSTRALFLSGWVSLRQQKTSELPGYKQTRSVLPNEAEAAHYYPAIYWYDTADILHLLEPVHLAKPIGNIALAAKLTLVRNLHHRHRAGLGPLRGDAEPGSGPRSSSARRADAPPAAHWRDEQNDEWAVQRGRYMSLIAESVQASTSPLFASRGQEPIDADIELVQCPFSEALRSYNPRT
jgi:hypothetical protein